MNIRINGRNGTKIDCRDRGLQYGDGVFETMRIRRGGIRLLEYHLQRLLLGCRRLEISGPPMTLLRRELEAAAMRRREGVLKLIVTRGVGRRGYRPTGREKCTRILSVSSLPKTLIAAGSTPARVRLCATQLGRNPRLAGLKTLNRLESVLARAEWKDVGIWEGLMRDADENIVCGTMSNLFVRRGFTLMTPLLDRCGVAGVMRRWVLEAAGGLGLRTTERRLRWQDLRDAEEVFMSNAVIGIRSVGVVGRGRERLRQSVFETADRLRERLELL
ncbi:MAG TPA: aminodeoxychorismate lyase [Steroidobacteraceae bacterium]|nr:aminodeoxychorismate lyase [Steroidobacteraceae bacterium]